jgi:hypothetical protein
LLQLTLAARPGSGKNLKGQGGAGAGSVFRNLESGRTFTYSQVGAQKKTAWRKLYLLAASQLNLREKFLGIQDISAENRVRNKGQSDPSSRSFDRRDSKSAAHQLSRTGSAVESSQQTSHAKARFSALRYRSTKAAPSYCLAVFPSHMDSVRREGGPEGLLSIRHSPLFRSKLNTACLVLPLVCNVRRHDVGLLRRANLDEPA